MLNKIVRRLPDKQQFIARYVEGWIASNDIEFFDSESRPTC